MLIYLLSISSRFGALILSNSYEELDEYLFVIIVPSDGHCNQLVLVADGHFIC